MNDYCLLSDFVVTENYIREYESFSVNSYQAVGLL